MAKCKFVPPVNVFSDFLEYAHLSLFQLKSILRTNHMTITGPSIACPGESYNFNDVRPGHPYRLGRLFRSDRRGWILHLDMTREQLANRHLYLG